VRVAAAGHEVLDGEALGRDGRLREDAQPPGDLARGQLGDRLAVEEHCAAARADEPRERAPQRRLAAPVGADDGRDPLEGTRRSSPPTTSASSP
jgi:hypothetical protein